MTPVGTATGAPTSAQRLAARADCQNLLIDDFELQSRLTFLYYNAIFVPSSDDGSMKSVVVGTPAPHRMTLTPRNVESYWYSEFNCVDAVNTFDGISMRIKATAGTTLTIQLQSSSSCSSEENLQTVEQTSSQLGWSFDGTEKLYSIPFSKFKGLEIEQLVNILFTDLTRPVSYGPLAFYCGDTASEYIAATTSEAPTPTSTVPITTETGNALVINTFANQASNNLNFWHGGDDGLNLTWGRNKLTIQTNDTDLAFYSQLFSNLHRFYLSRWSIPSHRLLRLRCLHRRPSATQLRLQRFSRSLSRNLGLSKSSALRLSHRYLHSPRTLHDQPCARHRLRTKGLLHHHPRVLHQARNRQDRPLEHENPIQAPERQPNLRLHPPELLRLRNRRRRPLPRAIRAKRDPLLQHKSHILHRRPPTTRSHHEPHKRVQRNAGRPPPDRAALVHAPAAGESTHVRGHRLGVRQRPLGRQAGPGYRRAAVLLPAVRERGREDEAASCGKTLGSVRG